MFFPLRFWIQVGDIGLASHRKRRTANPIRPLTDLECIEAVGPVLGKPFEPAPERVSAYKEAVTVSNLMRMGPTPTQDEIQAILSDRDLAVDTKPYLLFKRSLAHCEPIFQKLAPLLTGPDWQYPVQVENEPELEEAGAFKRLNMVLQAHARIQWLEGKEARAMESIRQSVGFIDRIQGSSGYFLHFLVGQSCTATLMRMFRMTAFSNPPSEDFLLEIDAILDKLGNQALPWRKIFEDEFRFAVVPSVQLRGLPWETKREWIFSAYRRDAYVLQQILVEWIVRNHPKPLDRVASLEAVRQLFEELEPLFDDPPKMYEMLTKKSNDLAGVFPAWFSTMFFDPHARPSSVQIGQAVRDIAPMQNPLGAVYMGKLTSVAAKLVLGSMRVQAEARAIRVCLAAFRHTEALGAPQKYESVKELVDAGFLDQIPSDPLWGGEVRFDAGRQVVWYPGPRNFNLQQTLESKGSGDAWIWPLNRLTV